MDELLAGLSQVLRADVLAAVAAVECADTPVGAEDFAALRDPALRRSIEEVLAVSGRTLIEHPGGCGSPRIVEGFFMRLGSRGLRS